MFFKNESICYFNIFMLFSFDTALQKSGGPVPPGPPPGFDATELQATMVQIFHRVLDDISLPRPLKISPTTVGSLFRDYYVFFC